MKKIFLFLTAAVMIGCSDDDSSSNSTGGTSFNFDGTTYQLQPGMDMNMSEIIMSDVMEFNGETYDRSTLSVTGINGMSASATVSFDLYYKSGTSVAGTYTIYDNEADDTGDFEDFLATQERGCMGWTSAGMAFTMGDGNMVSGNNPTGTVKVIVNSATNYTLIYEGNFREYDGFDFVRNIPTNIHITSNVHQN